MPVIRDHSFEQAWGALLLRVSLGMLFTLAGLGKFMGGTAGVRRHIQEQFAESWLPGFLIVPYAAVLPFAELILGVLILTGLFRGPALWLGSLLMLSLAFGMMVLQQWDVVSGNVMYAALFAAAFFTAPWDRYTLDRLLRRNAQDGPARM